METNVVQNQGYWFVVRDDQSNVFVLRDERDSNVLFSSDNIPIQNSQTGETRYIEPNDNTQYLQLTEQALEPQVEAPQNEKITKLEEFWDKNKVKLLLSLCLEDRFSVNSNDKDKAMWGEIAALVGTTPEACNKKYRNLKRTYIRLLKNKRLGKEVKWVHFNLCEEIFKYYKTLSPSALEIWEDSKIRRLLTLYIENLNRFQNNNCIKKEIWKEIAANLGKTEYSCYHKFKNLKRTYFSWLEKNRDSTRSLKWPYHQYFNRIFYNYNPNAVRWSSQRIKLLLDAYAQIGYKFNSSKFQKKELWKDIANTVGETASNCDRKFRNLKQTYIKLKYKSPNRNVKWRYYKDFESIFGFGNQSCMEMGNMSRSQDEDYVRQLLTYYIDNKDKFRNPSIKNKGLWKMIATKLGLSCEECDKKFRNLKQTYLRLVEKKRETGGGNNWPYFSYFEMIYDDDDEVLNKPDNTVDDLSLSEIKTMVQEVEERRENDRRFEKLIEVAEESNNIQRERNKILQALLDRR